MDCKAQGIAISLELEDVEFFAHLLPISLCQGLRKSAEKTGIKANQQGGEPRLSTLLIDYSSISPRHRRCISSLVASRSSSFALGFDAPILHHHDPIRAA